MINDVEAVILSDGCCETVTIVHCAIITRLYFDQPGEQTMFWPITVFSGGYQSHPLVGDSDYLKGFAQTFINICQ